MKLPLTKQCANYLARHFAVAFLSCGYLLAQATAPDRKVQGNVITSLHDPAIQIELPWAVHYVGADRWILYGIADCELHAFVEADARRHVQRLYWVQFEAYITSRPELKHTYDSPRHATLGGLDFYVDTWVRARGEDIQPGSDREHIEHLILAQGYTMPANMMYVRLVHLLDDTKRRELMIIYGESLDGTPYTAADLKVGGKAYTHWPSLEHGLIDQAMHRVQAEKTGIGAHD